MRKNEKLDDKTFMRLFVPSVISILLCMTVLVSTTFAWFSSTIESDSTVIASSEYVTAVSLGDTLLTKNSGIYTVSAAAGLRYDVTVTAKGNGNGYCRVWAKDGTYVYSVNIPATVESTTFTFGLVCEEDTLVYVCPVWGSLADSSVLRIKNGQILNVKSDLTITIAEVAP